MKPVLEGTVTNVDRISSVLDCRDYQREDFCLAAAGTWDGGAVWVSVSANGSTAWGILKNEDGANLILTVDSAISFRSKMPYIRAQLVGGTTVDVDFAIFH